MDIAYGTTAIAVLFLALLYVRRVARSGNARRAAGPRRRRGQAQRSLQSPRSDMRAGESTITVIETLRRERPATKRG